mgnify:CR=1 FL=1|jgi:hypothetical protein
MSVNKLNLKKYKGRHKFSAPLCRQRGINNDQIKTPKNLLGIIEYSEVKKTHKKKKPKALRGIR